jgi:polyhydroxybutyrate depolymerase
LVVVRTLPARMFPLALVAAAAASVAVNGGAPAPPPTLGSASAGCGGPAAPAGDEKLAIVSRGVRRTARVHVAPAAARAPAALVLAFHGTGGNGRFMERYSGLDAELDRGEAIGVFPDADGPRWNVEERGGAADDVDFARDLTAVLSARYCIDVRRIYAVGVSNGGSMAALLACTMPQLTGVAIVAGGFATLPPCRSKRPVSVLEIHGRDDPVAPYRGLPEDDRRGAVVPWLTSWIRRDRCQRRHPRARLLAAGTIRYDWGGCRQGTAVVHIAIAGGRHQWPGATPPDPGPRATISAAEQIWSFLSRLRLARR